MTNSAVRRLARKPRPSTVGGVVARLEAIEAAIDERSGIAAFNRLYRWTTEQVAAAIDGDRFEARDDMVTLDLYFAGLYFDAFDAWATGERVPGAWRPLVEREGDRAIPAVQFALAGMHAHINRDLAVALARTSRGPLREDSKQFRDYQVINAVLDATSDQIRGRILPPHLVAADEALGEVDDRLVLQGITTARRAAWEVAERLQALRAIRPAYDAALSVLDVSVGAIARAILEQEVPTRPAARPQRARGGPR